MIYAYNWVDSTGHEHHDEGDDLTALATALCADLDHGQSAVKIYDETGSVRAVVGPNEWRLK